MRTKAYTRFVREAIGGGLFSIPNSSDGDRGAWAYIRGGGPWDFVGQVELREGTIDKAITRNLDRGRHGYRDHEYFS